MEEEENQKSYNKFSKLYEDEKDPQLKALYKTQIDKYGNALANDFLKRDFGPFLYKEKKKLKPLPKVVEVINPYRKRKGLRVFDPLKKKNITIGTRAYNNLISRYKKNPVSYIKDVKKVRDLEEIKAIDTFTTKKLKKRRIPIKNLKNLIYDRTTGRLINRYSSDYHPEQKYYEHKFPPKRIVEGKEIKPPLPFMGYKLETQDLSRGIKPVTYTFRAVKNHPTDQQMSDHTKKLLRKQGHETFDDFKIERISRKTIRFNTRYMVRILYHLKSRSEYINAIEAFYNVIYPLIVANKPKNIVLKFFDPSDSDTYVFRSIPTPSLASADLIYNMIMDLQEDVATEGSDYQILEEGMIVDFSSFELIKITDIFGGNRKKLHCAKDRMKKFGHYKTYDIYSVGNNCFFSCIRKILDTKERVKTLRERCFGPTGNPPNHEELTRDENGYTGIKPDGQTISIIEDVLNINIDIYKLELGEDNETLYFYKSQEKYEQTAHLLLHEEHYYMIREIIDEIPKSSNRGDLPKRYSNPEFDEIVDDFIEIQPDIKNTKKPKAIKKSYTHIMTYDLETVNDEKHNVRAYCATTTLYDRNRELPPYVKGQTFENCNIKEHGVESKFFCGENCVNDMIDYILNFPKSMKVLIISYNGSRYDNYRLIEHIRKRNTIGKACDYFEVKNSILTIKLFQHLFIDLNRFLLGSLKDMCNSYQTERKKVDGFDHEDVQQHYEEGKLNEWIDKNIDKLKEYSIMDVECLMELFIKFTSLMPKIGIDFWSKVCPTIGSLAYNHVSNQTFVEEDGVLRNFTEKEMKDFIRKKELFRERKLKDEYEEKEYTVNQTYKLLASSKRILTKNFKNLVPRPKTYQDDLWFRKCLTAGRTEVFKKGHFKFDEPLAFPDITSLYPFVMSNKFYYPIVDYEYTDKYIPDKLGVYWIKYQNTTEESNILPQRYDDPTLALNYKSKELFETGATNLEIELCKKYGHHFEVINGVYWENDTNILFHGYIEKIIKEKSNQDKLKAFKDPNYNEALREICKLFMNSVSGKVIERNFIETTMTLDGKTYDDDTKILDNFHEDTITYTKIGNQCYVKGKLKNEELIYRKTAKPSYLGLFIYSYARSYMYELLISKAKTKIYMDTDSLAFEQKELQSMKEGELLEDFWLYKTFINCSEKDKHTGIPIVIHTDKFKPKQLGQMSDDGEGMNWTECITLKPKSYLLISSDGLEKTKTRYKGMSKRFYILPQSDEIELPEIVELPEDKGRIRYNKHEIIKFTHNNQLNIRKFQHQFPNFGKNEDTIQVYFDTLKRDELLIQLDELDEKTKQEENSVILKERSRIIEEIKKFNRICICFNFVRSRNYFTGEELNAVDEEVDIVDRELFCLKAHYFIKQF